MSPQDPGTETNLHSAESLGVPCDVTQCHPSTNHTRAQIIALPFMDDKAGSQHSASVVVLQEAGIETASFSEYCLQLLCIYS